MTSSRAFSLLVLAAAMATGAHAQTGRTRAEVKAELAEAIRTGNMIGSGESGLTLRELNPQRYGATPAAASTLTRAQVTGEYQRARLAGEVMVGEAGLPQNQVLPGNYPAQSAVAGKSRAEVKAELAEAIRTGNVLAGGESGQLLKDVFPQRYANVKPMDDAPMQAGMPAGTQVH
jgi:predicted RNase H-like HicB family nuclease